MTVNTFVAEDEAVALMAGEVIARPFAVPPVIVSVCVVAVRPIPVTVGGCWLAGISEERVVELVGSVAAPDAQYWRTSE